MSAGITWGFHNPVRVRFGRGCRALFNQEIVGHRCLVVTSNRGRTQNEKDHYLMQSVREGNLQWNTGVQPNPGLDELQAVINGLGSADFDSVFAFGGGSAIDSAKALAVALSRDGRGTSLRSLVENPSFLSGVRPLPLHAIPTTFGTGSEVTPFATIWDRRNRRKHSISGPSVFPRAAFVDPDLAGGEHVSTTLSTGLDALNQAAESIWNRNLTPISEGFATRAIVLGLEALPKLAANAKDDGARTAMAECSLLAGLAISQTRTALCHSISYPLTAHFGVPHGLACAFTMEAVLRFNLATEDSRFERLAAAIDASDASVEGLLRRINGLVSALKVRESVKSKVEDLEHLLALAPEMFTPGRTDNNLAPVRESDIREILTESWGVGATR